MQRVGQRNVVDESALSTQQLRIDIPFNASAECTCRHAGLSVTRGPEVRQRAELPR